MSNWNAGHTPYHYPIPLQSPTPRTPYYPPPPSAQWPAASARYPSTASLESRRTYGTAPSHAPSIPYIPTPPYAEAGADHIEQVYSPSVAASLGLNDGYGSRSAFDQAPIPEEDDIFIPPSPTPSEREEYRARTRAVAHARARVNPPSSYALGALTPYQRSQCDLDPAAYQSMNSSSTLPTLPSPAPEDSGITVYVGSNGGPAPDVTITTRPHETVVQIKHRPHREERSGDRHHRS